MLQTLSNIINTQLNTLTGVGQPLARVYDYHTLDSEAFPFATFELDSVEGNLGDSCHVERHAKFEVFVIQEMNNRKRTEALNAIYKCIEDIMNVIDSGSFPGYHKTKATGGNISQYQNEKGNVLIGTVELYITYTQQT